MKTYLLQNDDGQVAPVHSISAGLDYPGVGPEHSFLKDLKRVKYVSVTDDEALEAVKLVSKQEGILVALETAHAFAYLQELMPKTEEDQIVVVNTSGRGDKDLNTIINKFGDELK
jgi:tryptophan synthase beta chain